VTLKYCKHQEKRKFEKKISREEKLSEFAYHPGGA
jgi:hypothetical protein